MARERSSCCVGDGGPRARLGTGLGCAVRVASKTGLVPIQLEGLLGGLPHDARHAAATLLLAQGVDQRVVMEILGHSQISMTSRYAHVLPQVMTDAAERIGQALWG